MNPNPNPFEVFRGYKQAESESICESKSESIRGFRKVQEQRIRIRIHYSESIRGFREVQEKANPNPNHNLKNILQLLSLMVVYLGKKFSACVRFGQ